jgi:hypothetical protein
MALLTTLEVLERTAQQLSAADDPAWRGWADAATWLSNDIGRRGLPQLSRVSEEIAALDDAADDVGAAAEARGAFEDEAELLMVRRTALHAAAVRAAANVVARPKDGSFLEKTLRDGLAAQLQGATTEQPLNLDRDVWAGRLGGVDVLYTDQGMRIGVETKVWDVNDSLYDVFKLAAGTQRGTIAIGYCVIAGRTRDWRAPSAIHEMSQTLAGTAVEWATEDVLRDHAAEWARIYARTAIRPTEIPTRLRTLASEPIPMPQVPDHQIRIIGVQAIGADCLGLDEVSAALLDH